MKQTLRICRVLAAACLLLFPLAAEAKIATPEQYAQQVRDYFADEQWEEGHRVLDEALGKYPSASNLHQLMGKYWFHAGNLDKSRYHLIKAVDANYDDVEAKQLLVDVEDLTGNYSSAICYVNELLEVEPYARGLWRRKIELYRKQGNTVEADRLLHRINQIYPQDTVLRKDFVYTMELKYQRQKRTGDRKAALATLEELMKRVPDNEQYYLDRINLHLQEGDTEQALAWASAGLAALPASTALTYKKAGILSETARHPEAMAFMRARLKTYDTPQMRQLYNELLLESARAERQRDAYVLYGMAFERGDRSREVLDYLLNTALMRGYDEDALLYLRETKRRYGTDKALLYKEYLLYRNMGEQTRAFNLLARLCDRYPEDTDLSEAMCALQLQRASELVSRELYSDALPCARHVLRLRPDAETERAARDRILGCQIGMKRYDEALATLDTLTARYPDYENAVGKRAFLLDRTGRTTEALALYRAAIATTEAGSPMRAFYVAGYEEIAIPYIKRCLESGATAQALEEAAYLWEAGPSDDLALRYAINAAAQSGSDEALRAYADRGLTHYPDEPFFAVKKAALLDKEGDYDGAIELVRPYLDRYPGNRELAGALAQSSEYRALELSREGEPDAAIAVIDTALRFDPENRSLLYAKGLAYEKKKEYDTAYELQSRYDPSCAEQRAFARHLKGLRHATLRNEVGLEYLQSRYGEKDAITSTATLQYTRKEEQNTYTGRINYAGRNGTSNEELAELDADEIESGGVGFQLQAEWIHRFGDDWQGMINAAWADRFFPRWTANAALARYFKHDWELELRGGYRRLDERNLYSFGPGVAKFWGPLWANAKCDFFVLDGNLYYNVMAQTRYYPLDDGRSYVVGMAGLGSAPELNVLDRAMPGTFSHVNTMVGLGGQYLLTPNITVGVLGTWHTYYTEKRTDYDAVLTRYRNLYNIYVQLYISF